MRLHGFSEREFNNAVKGMQVRNNSKSYMLHDTCPHRFLPDASNPWCQNVLHLILAAAAAGPDACTASGHAGLETTCLEADQGYHISSAACHCAVSAAVHGACTAAGRLTYQTTCLVLALPTGWLDVLLPLLPLLLLLFVPLVLLLARLTSRPPTLRLTRATALTYGMSM